MERVALIDIITTQAADGLQTEELLKENQLLRDRLDAVEEVRTMGPNLAFQ